MRVWLSLVVVLGSSLAFAESKTRIVLGEDDEAVRAAFTDEVMPKIDACWTKPAKTSAKIQFDAGKVTRVLLMKNGDPRATKCLTDIIKTLVVANAPPRWVVMVELDATKLKVAKLDEALAKDINSLGTSSRAEGTLGATAKPAAPTAKVTFGVDAKPEGALAKDVIDRVIKGRTGMFRACYQREIDRDANVSDGKVVVSFQIGENGAVKTANLMSSTINSALVDKCLVTNMLRIKFPSASGATVVNYPFLFKRS